MNGTVCMCGNGNWVGNVSDYVLGVCGGDSLEANILYEYYKFELILPGLNAVVCALAEKNFGLRCVWM